MSLLSAAKRQSMLDEIEREFEGTIIIFIIHVTNLLWFLDQILNHFLCFTQTTLQLLQVVLRN